ncbi:MAG: hypothetical protein KIT83_14045 [Bryobacterales bacterium]|nr:hypothetical protein [Bryobacterales bacterium]
MTLSRRGHSLSLLSLGALTLVHAVLVFTVVVSNRDALVLLALILFSLSLNTMILSVVARLWSGSRITCWVGLLRLILCLTLLGPVAQDQGRGYFAVALLIVITGLLEAYIWVQARLEESHISLFGLAALANILLGSFALINYHWHAAGSIVFSFGLSLVISSLGPISASSVVRRREELAHSVLQQTSETPISREPIDHKSLASLTSSLKPAPTAPDFHTTPFFVSPCATDRITHGVLERRLEGE